MRHTRHQRIFMAVFLAPAFFLFTAFVAVPGIRALLFSLRRWNGFTEPEWAGLDNFVWLFSRSELFLSALAHNAFLTVVPGALILLLALSFAALLHRRIHGAAVFRVAFFFPNVIALVAIALLWLLLYSATEFGVINAALRQAERLFGADFGLPFPFLDSKYLMYSLVPMMVWTMTGFYMVLFLAAMEGIPETFYEVAKLEGATGLQQFRHITLPLIRDVVTVGAVFLLITSLKFFDPIWVIENQRPTKDAHVLTTMLYQKVFSEYDVGRGSAVAVFLFVLVFCATLASLRLSRAERVEY